MTLLPVLRPNNKIIGPSLSLVGLWTGRLLRNSLRQQPTPLSPGRYLATGRPEDRAPVAQPVELERLVFTGKDQGTAAGNFKWLSAPDLIRSLNLVCEEHEVRTEDGYKLRLLRIPGESSSRPSIVLFHGFYNSCRDWLVSNTDALPYHLHKSGFDVWLANNRGTTYSEHQTFSRSMPEFWNFGNKDVAMKDHPAVLDYVLEETGRKLVCIVYSWSGFTLMKLLSTEARFNSQLLELIGIAPYICSGNVSSWMRYLARPRVKEILVSYLAKSKYTKHGCLIPSHTREFSRKNYEELLANPSRLRYFERSMEPFVGRSDTGTSKQYFGEALHEFPNDVSITCAEGLLDNMITPKFCSSLGTPSTDVTPYDLAKVVVPKTFYFMETDALVSLKDGRELMDLCGSNAKGYVVTGFNHMDALYGNLVGQLNATIVKHLEEFLKS